MRIRNITIRHWRHFENIELGISDDTGLVCVVGPNGSGKSHLLELIAACAHRIGLAPGSEIPRGDPFSDQHEFSLKFHIATGISRALDDLANADAGFQNWDRTLTISSQRIEEIRQIDIRAGGVLEGSASQVGRDVVAELQKSQDVHFLSLDSDRSYPKPQINVNQVAEAYEIDWAGTEYTRGRSFRTTKTLYDEWIKYFLARENQAGTSMIQGIRRAKKLGTEPPEFLDHFADYTESLQQVLPHVIFVGVASKRRTLLFDTTGLELTFDQLSGGEREIAFLIGQIDRFGLRQGLLLIDEPELHLNADLIRSWVTYLTGTVSSGQIWLATHSLEAVEAAGATSTFVLERDDATRKVNGLARLDSRPMLSALSRAVGTPAFSISQLRFAFVEGEEHLGERERFRRLAGGAEDVRFMEGGSCMDVIRRVAIIKSLENEAEGGIRIGGIVDRDFRSDEEVEQVEGQSGVHVMRVHEAENYFLHPGTLQHLLGQNGRHDDAHGLIVAAGDARAGGWIFQKAMTYEQAKTLPEITSAAKDRIKAITWSQLDADFDTAIANVLAVTRYDEPTNKKFALLLRMAAKLYSEERAVGGFWKSCEGKEVLNEIAPLIGFAGSSALMAAAYVLWDQNHGVISQELLSLRDYVQAL